MPIDSALLADLDVALDESTLWRVEFDPESRVAIVMLTVLLLPVGDGPAEARPVCLILRPVGRLAASLRHGSWDDREAHVEGLELDDLPRVFDRLGGQSIYGGTFFNVPEVRPGVFDRPNGFALWSDRLSVDWMAPRADGQTHTLLLFQEGAEGDQLRHLDVQLWFDELEARTVNGDGIRIDDLVSGARRWWRALFEGDARTQRAISLEPPA
jgi:hypothetical protein